MPLLNTNHNLLLSNGSMHLLSYHSLPSSDSAASFDAHYLCFFTKNRVTGQCAPTGLIIAQTHTDTCSERQITLHNVNCDDNGDGQGEREKEKS